MKEMDNFFPKQTPKSLHLHTLPTILIKLHQLYSQDINYKQARRIFIPSVSFMGNTLTKAKQIREETEYQEGEEDDVSSFTCEICIEPVPSTGRFKKTKCSHRSYCSDCIAKYIEVKIEEHMSEIKCPGLDCGEVLEPLSCRSILSVRVFEKWCDVLCESTVLQRERAYCPYTDCSALIVNECGGKVRKTECPNCKKWLCFKCEVPWHSGWKCSETGQFLGDENGVLLGRLMKEKKWRRCPVCNHGVELSTGCKFVRCRCGTKFCHGCGRKRTREWCWCKKQLPQNLALLATVLFCFFLSLACIVIASNIKQRK